MEHTNNNLIAYYFDYAIIIYRARYFFQRSLQVIDIDRSMIRENKIENIRIDTALGT